METQKRSAVKGGGGGGKKKKGRKKINTIWHGLDNWKRRWASQLGGAGTETGGNTERKRSQNRLCWRATQDKKHT